MLLPPLPGWWSWLALSQVHLHQEVTPLKAAFIPFHFCCFKRPGGILGKHLRCWLAFPYSPLPPASSPDLQAGLHIPQNGRARRPGRGQLSRPHGGHTRRTCLSGAYMCPPTPAPCSDGPNESSWSMGCCYSSGSQRGPESHVCRDFSALEAAMGRLCRCLRGWDGGVGSGGCQGLKPDGLLLYPTPPFLPNAQDVQGYPASVPVLRGGLSDNYVTL